MQISKSWYINKLFMAVVQGDLHYLFDAVCPKNVNYTDPRYGLTLLQWAVSLSRLPTVELLLSRGATLFTTDLLGFSPLHRAVWRADASVVRTLLFLSPSSAFAITDDNRNRSSCRPFVSSSPISLTSTTEDPYKSSSDDSGDCVVSDTSSLGSHSSAVQPTPRATATVAQYRAALNAPTWRPGAQRLVNMPHVATGRTPLMLAAARGNEAIVTLLINVCGADIYMKDKDGFTAADLAALCGHTAILQLFLLKVEGDGTGRAFQSIQQQAEEFCDTAKTLAQRERLNQMNNMMCLDLSLQSYVSSR